MNPSEPSIFRWYRFYCGVLALLYILFLAGGLVVFVLAPQLADAKNPEPLLKMLGIGFAVGGFIFSGVFLVSFFLPTKKWAWIYHTVLICIGFGSICTLPFSIALLIHWIKPEVQEYFSSAP